LCRIIRHLGSEISRNGNKRALPVFKLGHLLVRFNHVARLHRKRESHNHEKRSVAIHRASTDTSVALIMAKTASPFLRFIRFTEPVVMIEVTGPASVLMTISETTLSETICSTVPGKRLRMLVLMTLRGYLTSATASTGASSCPLLKGIPSGDVIESQIDGEFEGWEGETIVKLINGQIWQQTEYYYTYHYAYMPEVLVYRSSFGYKMKVDGVDQAVGVTRLR
jgi:hypothetical protein